MRVPARGETWRSIAPATFLLLTAILHAQVNPKSINNVQAGEIDGRVTNALTGDLVSGAIVHLIPLRFSGNEESEQQAKSQSDGAFRFANVAPGQYILTAQRQGYVPNVMNTRSRLVVLAPGEIFSDAGVELIPQGTIGGKITDDAGKPVVCSTVEAFLPITTRGRTVFKQQGTAGCDKYGHFVLPQLPPGSYYLVADPPESRPSLVGEDQQKVSKSQNKLVRTVYPRSLDFEGASRVEIAAGQILSGITISVRRATTYSVRGKIEDTEQQADRYSVALAPRGTTDGPALSRIVRPDAKGAFEIRDVLPGSYTLTLNGRGSAVRNHLLARQELEVGATDVDGVALAPMPSVVLSGRVTVEGSGEIQLSRVRVLARSTEETSHVSHSLAIPTTDGTFTLSDLDPSYYVITVTVNHAGMYVKSIYLNQQDIKGKEIDLTHGGSGQLEIVLRGGAGEVDGTLELPSSDVVNSRVRGMVSGTMVLVPENPGQDGSGVQFAYAHQANMFSIPNIAPGNYYAYAVDRADPNLWQNPDFLGEIRSLGTAIEVEENQRKEIQLRKISFDQVQQAAARIGLNAQY